MKVTGKGQSMSRDMREIWSMEEKKDIGKNQSLSSGLWEVVLRWARPERFSKLKTKKQRKRGS